MTTRLTMTRMTIRSETKQSNERIHPYGHKSYVVIDLLETNERKKKEMRATREWYSGFNE